MYDLVNLKGTTLIFSPLKNMETAALGVFLKVGSRFEAQKVKGIAHYLEHMVFKGSESYSRLQIKREIEGRGGSLNAFTSQEITGYYASFLNKNLAPTLDILLDMVFRPSLKKTDLNKERGVILEEIKMYNDLPGPRAGSLLDQLLWNKHPLGQDVIGQVSTVKSINCKDLENFKNQYYLPSNMVISFSGNFPKQKIIDLIRKKIETNTRKANLKTAPPESFKGLRIKCEKKGLQQTHLCLDFRSISYLNKKRLVNQLLNVILGANMSSRLFEELREKRSLCYEISSEARKYRDTGAFVIHTGLDKSKIMVATCAILQELNKIKAKEVLAKELSRAKDYLLGQTAMGLERPQGRMFYLADGFLTLGRIDDFKEIKKKVEAISPGEIQKLAQDIFNFKNICISCVGDTGDNLEQRIKQALKS
jgi:predicted Zn-dependent peptidase